MIEFKTRFKIIAKTPICFHSFKSNDKETTYFTTIYLQTDIALICQYTISEIKTTNSHVSINLTKNL